MGHARVVNISRLFNRLVREKGAISVKEVVDELERHKMSLHASEGHLSDRPMLGLGTEQVLWSLYALGAVEPVEMTPRQARVFKRMAADEDVGLSAYDVFDTIRWRARKKRLPVIVNMET